MSSIFSAIGATLSAVAAVAAAVASLIEILRKGPTRKSPTISGIEASWAEEAALVEAAAIQAQAEAARAEAEIAREKAVEAERQAAMLAHKKAVEEEKRKAREAQAAADEEIKKANERAHAAQQAQKKAMERLKKGIQPVAMPSAEEVEAVKTKVEYDDQLFHFAVAGAAGAGKSSLINAFRGLRNRDEGAAPTGVTETTLEINRLPDPVREKVVWYDIPGAGTLKVPGWQYFNNQGLYVFDCIIVLVDSRFTATEIAILRNSMLFDIPTYLVRSKADVHIRNLMREEDGYDSNDDSEDARSQRKALYGKARDQYIAETRASIKQNLETAKLPDKKVYIVSNDVLLTIVKNLSRIRTSPPRMIDELNLMNDLFREACSRRCA
ncbi:P-loop containing nucleoside triphosphate hydrolase protein [Gyrodon lividus]|nr:P-loop containing nucleoside triphosphate hydrolase protein [Gyrodon lividus]